MLDYTRLRPDVAAYFKKAKRRQTLQGLKYLLLHPGVGASLLRINRRLKEDNERLLQSGAIDLEKAELYLPDQETRLSYARLTRAVLERITRKVFKGHLERQGVRIEAVRAGDVPAEWVIPGKLREGCAILHMHGGGFNLCSPATHRALTARLSTLTNTRILSVDYRLAPEHRFPAALDDCLQAFQWLVDQGYPAETIIFLGDSAGGNLALAGIHGLKQQGKNLPAAAVCLSPFTDWTFSGKSWFDNAPTDPIIADLPVPYYGKCYLDLAEVDLRDPLISPLFGDYRGFPPLQIIVSRSEMCCDDSRRVADKALKAGVEVRLEEWDDMIHVFPLFGLATGWPEPEEALARMAGFIDEKLAG